MPSSPDLVEAAERNYLVAWRILASRANGGEIDDRGHMLFTTVPAPVAYFNSAFVRPPADPVACIDQARTFFGERNRPFTLRFREPDSPTTTRQCEAAGLVAAGTSPLMIAATADIAPPAEPDIRRVDAQTWDDHLSTIAKGFGIPIELLTGLISSGLLDSDEYAGFTAYVDGKPASTATLFVSDEVAGVYNVATPEPYRRRGLGEATTSAAVAEGARRGCTLTTLQASEMGYPIYERMGFETVVHWLSFTG